MSSSAQGAALELHDSAQNKESVKQPRGQRGLPSAVQNAVSYTFLSLLAATKIGKQGPSFQIIPPEDRTPTGTISPGQRSIGRGELDKAIRSMKAGVRRPRHNKASKIFLDT